MFWSLFSTKTSNNVGETGLKDITVRSHRYYDSEVMGFMVIFFLYINGALTDVLKVSNWPLYQTEPQRLGFSIIQHLNMRFIGIMC